MRRVLVALAAVLAMSLSLTAGAQAKMRLHLPKQQGQAAQQRTDQSRKKDRLVEQDSSPTRADDRSPAANDQRARSDAAKKSKRSPNASSRCRSASTANRKQGTAISPVENECEELETFQTTALDVPFKGEFVGAWFLIDGCNTARTASVQGVKALAPRATDPRTPLLQRRLFP